MDEQIEKVEISKAELNCLLTFRYLIYEIVKQAGGEIRVEMTPFNDDGMILKYRKEEKGNKEFMRVRLVNSIGDEKH
jgi:hypothetical protein